MPRVLYQCNLCPNKIKKFYNSQKEVKGYLNCECGGVMERQLSSPSSNSKQYVDNGVQAKRTEVTSVNGRNVAEINKENSTKDPYEGEKLTKVKPK